MPELASPAEEELYGLDAAEFVAARNALAKRLKSEGQSDEAARVSVLRRPARTAAALNQLARRERPVVDDVLSAGRLLREATERALAGDRSDLAAAQAAQRKAIQEAVSVAEALSAPGGRLSDAARQRMAETLRAACVNPEVAEQLRRGVLESDVSAAGLGLEGIRNHIGAEAGPHPPADDQAASRHERKARLGQMRRELADVEALADQARARARAAEARAAELRVEADAAEERVRLVVRRVEELEASEREA